MTQPVQTPSSSPARRSNRGLRRLIASLALAVVAAAVVGAGAFEVGRRYSPAAILDPLWLRAYLNRPVDMNAPGAGFWIAGYMVDYDSGSFDVVKTRSTHMDQVVVFGYSFDPKGNVVGQDHQLVRGLTARQKRVILFNNATSAGFDKDLAHAILADPAVRATALNGIVERAKSLDAGGVQIDFENIPGNDREAYTAFLGQLKGLLQPQQISLSIAAAAKTKDSTDGWGGATDYAAIGQIVDQFYIMAYDEHWRGGEPGPVASLPWVEKVIRYATGVMPSQKVILGIPFYGYDWAVDPQTDQKGNKAYGSASMERRIEGLGGKAKWDPVSGENVATFKAADGTDRVAWWPSEQSLEAKLKLAYQYNLKGVAPWRLGFEPDEWWNEIGAFRVKPVK
jgi:spore germination protein